jgi:K+-sensing histidine kinase KdpD
MVSRHHGLELLGYAAGFASAIGIAIYNYFKFSSFKTRQQMKIVSLSCFAALVPFLIFSVLPEAIWQRTLLPSGSSILFISFIPLGLGYAVVTQKLMDIDVLIRRGVTYGLISLILAIVLSLGIFAVDQLQRSYSVPEEILLALGLGVVSALIFGPIKNTVERFVDRVFYKDRYEYRQIIQGLSAALNATSEFNEVSRLLVGTAANTLNLAGACLWSRTGSNEYELGAAQGIFTNPEILENSLSTIKERSIDVDFPNAMDPPSEALSFIIPLNSGDYEIGVLCLSPKANRQDFSSDDIFLIQGLAAVGAIALQGSLLVHDVSVQNTFVSIASHEMRTPLTSITGYTELLLKRNPDESQRARWLNIVLRNSQRITAMVNELLDVSRIHSGRVDVNIEKVELSEILDEVLALAENASDSHSIEVNICEDLHPLATDKNKCIQILWNLINNAIKYSPDGGIIRINAWDVCDEEKVIISVRDEGIGISPEDQEKLFATFFRVKRPETTSVPGSGLGLYISKKWIELMGGEIRLESQVNQGSVFYVSLPTKTSRVSN